jgi:hypothetical protein
VFASQLCLEGKFASGTGLSVCSDCLGDTIAPVKGRKDCVSCPEHSTPVLRQTCQCDATWFAFVEGSDGSGGGGSGSGNGASFVCKACPPGCVCKQGSTFEFLEAAEGYWRQSNDSDVFLRCLRPSHCVGGVGSKCAEFREGE